MSESDLPPSSLDIEAALLGSLLLDPAALGEVIPLLDPGDFLRDDHERLAGLLWARHADGRPIDPLLIAEELRKAKSLAGPEADLFLSGLMDRATISCNAPYYARTVRLKAISRRLIEAGNEIARDGQSNLYTAEEMLARADAKVFSIAEDLVGAAEPADATEVLAATFDRIELRRGGIVGGVTTGFRGLDDIIGCLRDANLAVLAARPAQGKTAMALNIACHVAYTLEVSTLFFSLEMERVDLGERLLSSRSGVWGKKFEDPDKLDDREIRAIGRVRTDLAAGRLAIDDCPSRAVAQLAAVSRLYQRRHGLGFVVIDYLSLIDGQPRRGESRQEEVARTARGIKALARTLNVPILLLCQLNREVEKRGDGPRLADLRESGQIEQEASVVMMLHRKPDDPGSAQVIVAKNRFGRTGIARLSFLRDCTRFEDMPCPGTAGADRGWDD